MILENEAQARAWFVAELGCDAATLAKLDRFVSLLRDENDRQNLVSAPSLGQVWLRHLADSAQLLLVPRETLSGPWLDLGSGAGFPGLVVALCEPSIEVVLAESRTKRIAWLETAIGELGIANARVMPGRLETAGDFAAGTICARAFSSLPQLLAVSARFSTPQTQWLLPKGRKGRQELTDMPKAVQAMFHVKHSLTDPDSVILVGQGVPPLTTERRR